MVIDNNSPTNGTTVSAIVMATIGLTGVGIQPVLVSALIQNGTFDAGSAGYVASAEVFGIAIMNVMMTFAIGRLSWRMLCGVGLLLMLVGNALSMIVGSAIELMMAARFISGLGAGLLVSCAYAAAGLTRDPDKMLGYILAAGTAHIALGSLLLPGLVERGGIALIFLYFGGLSLLGFSCLRWMPVGGGSSQQAQHSGSSLFERMAALTSVATLFLGLGVLWPYLLQIGLSIGATSDQAAIGLTVSQLAAFLGALLAALAGRVMPVFAMQLVALLVTVGSILLFQLMSGGLAYAILASSFNGASNTAIVLALGAVAMADIEGRWIAAAVTLETLGLAVGPVLAAQLVTNDNYVVVQRFSAGLIIVSAFVALLVAIAAKKRRSVMAQV